MTFTFAGSFHVLNMMFNEYVFLVMETQQANIRDSQQKCHMTKFLRNAGKNFHMGTLYKYFNEI